MTLALLAFGVVASERVAARLGTGDPGIVVIDEVVGFLVTMTFVAPHPGHILGGFVLFRALDILKPAGIAELEKMPGGLGIMMDDFAAGVIANVFLQLAIGLPHLL